MANYRLRKPLLLIAILSLLLTQCAATIKFTKATYSPQAPASQAGLVQAADTDWWPMFHHDLSHSGYSTSTAPKTNQTLWTYNTGWSLSSSPAVVNGIVYVVSTEGKVYALNASTGAQVWNYTNGGVGTWSCPAVVGGIVYVGSYDYKVYALNATTGALVWNYTNWSVQSFGSPAVANGVVYIGGDYSVYALNATTGKQIWNYATHGNTLYGSPAVANGIVYMESEGPPGNVYALNATTGALVWEYADSLDYVRCPPTVAGGIVYVGDDYGNVYALNATTGAQVWTYATGYSGPATSGVQSGPAVVGGVVYVGSGNYNVYALNATTGAVVWKYGTPGQVICSPAVASGIVYVGSNNPNGNFYALNATTGALVWEYITGGCIGHSSPAVANGVVYVGSGDDKVYAFGSRVTVSPLLAVTISPLSASISVGQSVTFSATVTGGVPPYTYIFYIDGEGIPVPGHVVVAGSNTTLGIVGYHHVWFVVTDSVGSHVTSATATIDVTSAPVGGYATPISTLGTDEPISLAPYIALVSTILAATAATGVYVKRRKRKQ